MNVVEAIDEWIDERIDNLDDDELESILEILDGVAASELSQVDADLIYDDDIADMVELVERVDSVYVTKVLREAIYGESSDADRSTAPDSAALDSTDATQVDDSSADVIAGDVETGDDEDLDDTGNDEDSTDDDAESDTAVEDVEDHTADSDAEINEEDEDDTAVNDEDEDHDPEEDSTEEDEDHDPEEDSTDDTEEDEDHDDEPDDEDDTAVNEEEDHDPEEDSTDDTEEDEDHDDEPDDEDDTAVNEEEDHDPEEDSTDDTEQATTELATAVLPKVLADVSPVELRAGDELGPSFLTLAPTAPHTPVKPWRKYGVAAFMLLGLAAFIFGIVQLVGSLGEEQAVAPPTATAQPTASPTNTPTAEPTLVATATTGTAGQAEQAEPTPTPPPPPTQVGLRLASGDVMLATFDSESGMATIDMIYDSSKDALDPAANLAWLDGRVGIIDENGAVLIKDPTDSAQATLIYEPSDDLSPAADITALQDRFAIRTVRGDLILMAPDEPADVDNITVAWDSTIEDQAVTGIDSVNELLPFVLDNGNVKLLIATAEDTQLDIWSSDSQPPVFNLLAGQGGILMGVGQGAVARFRIGELSGAPPVEAVWDPFTTDELPAIAYSPAGNRTAVVLQDGAMVLADDTLTGERIWDPEETELRALSVIGRPNAIVALLETGTVVQIFTDQNNSSINSVWDITDESLAPAVQIVDLSRDE